MIPHPSIPRTFFPPLPSEDIINGEPKHLSRHFVGVKDAVLRISGQCHHQARGKPTAHI